ncbi:MAG: hypothetical protein ACI4JF_03290 [Oscillospiraceae bacterium]
MKKRIFCTLLALVMAAAAAFPCAAEDGCALPVEEEDVIWEEYLNYTSYVSKGEFDNAKEDKHNLVFNISGAVFMNVEYEDIDDNAKDADINVVFGNTAISDKLKSAAVKRNGGIASSRFSLGSGTDIFCFTGELNIRFGKRYDGKKAKLYRYDKDNKRLIYEDKCDIGWNGVAAFDVSRAGDYIAVIY